jgi:alkylhydroperoxidase family enzyme
MSIAITPATTAQDGATLDHIPFLEPVERPSGLRMRLIYALSRRQFGKVPTPASVFLARMPFAFANFSFKVSRLDRKLRLPEETVILVRERVASINVCTFCLDITRWYATNKAPHTVAKLDVLHEYRTSLLFNDAERAALDYATEVTESRHVRPETVTALHRHYGEREICELAWLVSSEHFYNISNIGLGIGSDGLCDVNAGR